MPFPPAIQTKTNPLCLWAESPEEARVFLRRARESGDLPHIEQIFVAKRSAKTRSNSYIEGLYYRTSNDNIVELYDVVVAPESIKESDKLR